MPKPLLFDLWLFFTVGVLAIGGVLMVGSASQYQALMLDQSPSFFFVRHGIFAIAGLCVLLACVKMPYGRLEDRRVVRWLVAATLVALVLVLLMPEAGGARRWFRIGPFKIQPAEFAKLTAIIVSAHLLAAKEALVNDVRRFILPFVAVLLEDVGHHPHAAEIGDAIELRPLVEPLTGWDVPLQHEAGHRRVDVDVGGGRPGPVNLLDLQVDPFAEFLQLDVAPTRRKNLGLQAVFKEVFPIESYDGKCILDFHSYEIGEAKLDWLECLREGLTTPIELPGEWFVAKFRALQPTRDGSMWVGTLRGLTRFHQQTRTKYTQAGGLGSDEVRPAAPPPAARPG